ncbi:hypothetical protein [Paraliomyxa miuraensis]|uniref:hypothetical protein n=1 Tax=Paraliomyxa miuraensis TaxID=376150 RepID=UPI00225B3210|nr:hypothetical protein [Paraliomyxa miuraensis]MCX4247630.1 hypothetical protein [Paraliomyxa miuraensis]
MTSRSVPRDPTGALPLVVPRSAVHERLDENAARRLLLEGLEDGNVGLEHELERLAKELCGTMVQSVREAVDVVAHALGTGRLVAITLPSTPRLLDAARVTDLREVGGWEVVDPLRPAGPPEPPPRPAATTWIWFVVVDERGVPAQGRFRLALDGTAEDGELDERAHRRTELREGADGWLAVLDLRWDDGSSRPPMPSRGDDPKPGASVVSLELVDERGDPMHARFALTSADGESLATGELGPRWQRALTGEGPVLLELLELRPEASRP